jgi:hypothetical protein
LESLPFLKHLAVMAADINGKCRRSGSFRLPSPSSLWPYLSSRSSSCPPLCLLSTPTRALEPQFPRRRHLCPPLPPVKLPSPVKGSSSPFLPLWSFSRRSLSFPCCRFTSLTPPGAPTPSAGAPPGSPSTRARSFASPSAPAVASGSARHGEQ